MLDLRFKSLYIISSFIHCEKGVDIVKEYERQFLYHMLFKCYHHLHPMKFFEVRCAKQTTDEDSNFDNF
jgi:retron-type reverse transcriptase